MTRNYTVGYKSELRGSKLPYIHDNHYEPIPLIPIKGKWLKELGFDIGTKVAVDCSNGKLVISILDNA